MADTERIDEGAVRPALSGSNESDACRVVNIIRKAATVYTKEGVGVWLLSANRRLTPNGKGEWRTPLDLIEVFDLDELEADVDGMAEGVFV